MQRCPVRFYCGSWQEVSRLTRKTLMRIHYAAKTSWSRKNLPGECALNAKPPEAQCVSARCAPPATRTRFDTRSLTPPTYRWIDRVTDGGWRWRRTGWRKLQRAAEICPPDKVTAVRPEQRLRRTHGHKVTSPSCVAKVTARFGKTGAPSPHNFSINTQLCFVLYWFLCS